MNALLMWIIVETGSWICLIGAGVLAFHGKDGWGWFLIVGLLLAATSTKEKKKKPETGAEKT